jgi:hypothetical protein
MILTRRTGLQLATAIGLLAISDGCVAPGSASISYGVGFYQPWGFTYGGWGPAYYVGPPRPGVWVPPPRRVRPAPFRPPPAGRQIPTIPSRPVTPVRRF